MKRNMWPDIRAGEQVISYFSTVKALKGGDLIPARFGVFASGRNQVLVVAVIDGYGKDDPVCWKAYSLPELECAPVAFEDFEDPQSYRIKINTFSDVRNVGDEMPEEDARRIFPFLEELRYGR